MSGKNSRRLLIIEKLLAENEDGLIAEINDRLGSLEATARPSLIDVLATGVNPVLTTAYMCYKNGLTPVAGIYTTAPPAGL